MMRESLLSGARLTYLLMTLMALLVQADGVLPKVV
jgi:hypothetical protein